MKAAILALAAAYANAQSTVVTTQNECWNTQGGYYAGNCRDVYYLTCDEYVLFEGSSCNVFTFSDSRIVSVKQRENLKNVKSLKSHTNIPEAWRSAMNKQTPKNRPAYSKYGGRGQGTTGISQQVPNLKPIRVIGNGAFGKQSS